MKAGSHVGNFVELKKTVLGEGSKASHLAYLGDATIGAGVNIGAGTITCNYDGEQKNPTVIEDGAFIGSDSQLIAPVRVGAGAYVAAGSSITDDVPAGALGIARGRQMNIVDGSGDAAEGRSQKPEASSQKSEKAECWPTMARCQHDRFAGPRCVAEEPRLGACGLPRHGRVSASRTVRPDVPAAPRRRLGSREHRRGLQTARPGPTRRRFYNIAQGSLEELPILPAAGQGPGLRRRRRPGGRLVDEVARMLDAYRQEGPVAADSRRHRRSLPSGF